MQKRYYVFAYDTYYPAGGLSDLIDTFDTLEEAKLRAEQDRADWREIFDMETRQQIEFIDGAWR
jgi:hypothetical protein